MRPRKTPQQLKTEKEKLRKFVLFYTQRYPRTMFTTMREIHRAYRKWSKSRVSVDSFGKLFPKIGKRKTMFVQGKACRVIFGVGLK